MSRTTARREERKDTRKRRVAERQRRTSTYAPGAGDRNILDLPEGVKYFTPEREATIEIVPFYSSGLMAGIDKGVLLRWVEAWIHRGVGTTKARIVCPKTFDVKARCPICEEWHRLQDDESQNEATVDALRPQLRLLYNVYDYADEGAGIKVWDVSYHLFQKFLEQEETYKAEKLNVDRIDAAHPDDGFTIEMKGVQKHFGKRAFYEYSAINLLKRGEPVGDDLIEQATPLDRCLIRLSYDQIEKVFLDLEGPSEGGEKAPPADEGRAQTRRQPPQEAEPEPEKTEAPEPAPQGRRRAAPSQEPEPTTTRRHNQTEPEPPPAEETKTAGSEGENPCPYGHRFGVDSNEKGECNDCAAAAWEACVSKKETDAKK
ncbi:MAG: hypothetical protein KJ556_20175 [Gammaproteobacteria bacterium]|nr:hypothetical protein [Gammaproteobacteria bacterium]